MIAVRLTLNTMVALACVVLSGVHPDFHKLFYMPVAIFYCYRSFFWGLLLFRNERFYGLIPLRQVAHSARVRIP